MADRPLNTSSDAAPRRSEIRTADLGADSSLPSNWLDLWNEKPEAEAARIHFQMARSALEQVAASVAFSDQVAKLESLVGSADLRTCPIHRWVHYKEGFSPALPGVVLDLLEMESSDLVVADCFSGVGTTALALSEDSRVKELRCVEYSPYALLCATVKISWRAYDVTSLRAAIPRLLDYRNEQPAPAPGLSTFGNQDVFPTSTLRALLQAKQRIIRDTELDESERAFFLVGLAATLEDLSGAMKDGRALRIKKTRKRKQTSLADEERVRKAPGRVKGTLELQWSEMVSDIASRQTEVGVLSNPVHLSRGDARDLAAVVRDGVSLFPDGSIDVFLYSPPYLNFLDYSEVYKLELWFLDLVRDQSEFRDLRLGTLRSHPSLKFHEPLDESRSSASVWRAIDLVATWLEQHAARRSSGVVVRQYFADIERVLVEQLRALRAGGKFACVVGNSTFANPRKTDQLVGEWRVPLLTDSLIAALAAEIGFEEVRVVGARELRPRNVKSGTARESVVTGMKPRN